MNGPKHTIYRVENPNLHHILRCVNKPLKAKKGPVFYRFRRDTNWSGTNIKTDINLKTHSHFRKLRLNNIYAAEIKSYFFNTQKINSVPNHQRSNTELLNFNLFYYRFPVINQNGHFGLALHHPQKIRQGFFSKMEASPTNLRYPPPSEQQQLFFLCLAVSKFQ